MKTSNRVVVITGASAGVGRAAAQAFAKEGAHIGLIARGEAGLQGAVHDVEQLGGKALAIPLDVSEADAVERAAKLVESHFGPIDVWVNNAMVSVFSPIKETSPQEFRRVTEVTYLGVVNGTLAALKRMLPRDHGVIIQVGSALAYRGIPLQAAYCAAKHAIQGFCDSLRSELLHEGTRVQLSMLQMPALNTPQFDWSKSRMPHRAQPVPPIYEPEVAARAIVYASHHPSREMWIGSPTIKAILGNRLIPGWLDLYLAKTGYTSQQGDEPENRERPDNLWTSLDHERDHGAHGRFDAIAKPYSATFWLRKNRRWLAALGAALGVMLLASGRNHARSCRE